MQRLQQAFREYPWLRQRRWWATVALMVLLLGAMTAIDLHLSSEQIVTVRETTAMVQEMLDLQVEIAALQSSVAAETRWREIVRRAQEMGLSTTSPADVRYVPVPGGLVKDVDAATQAHWVAARPDPIQPEYRVSLQEWLWRVLLFAGVHE